MSLSGGLSKLKALTEAFVGARHASPNSIESQYSVDPQAAFKDSLGKTIAPVLRERGFSRNKQTFYLKREGNWGVINFQKSMSSSAERVKFTVNVGVASARLFRFFPRMHVTDQKARPSVWDCHWQERTGRLLPERSDKWWTIDAETSIDKLGEELQEHILDVAVPTIQKYITDEALRDLWLAEHAAGHTMSLLNLAVLLKALGPQNDLDTVMEKLRRVAQGPPPNYLLEAYLHRLERERVE